MRLWARCQTYSSPVLVILGLGIGGGCTARSEKINIARPPVTPAVNHSAFVAHHKSARNFLRSNIGPSLTPEQKIKLGNDLLGSAKMTRQIAGATNVNSEDRGWAWNAFAEDERLAGTLFAEAGSDYTAVGDLQRARETYWTIIRVFTPPQFDELRRHAESRLTYLDDASRTQSQEVIR